MDGKDIVERYAFKLGNVVNTPAGRGTVVRILRIRSEYYYEIMNTKQPKNQTVSESMLTAWQLEQKEE